MKKRIIFAAALAALLSGACSKVIDFTGDFTNTELVMVSQAEADSAWHIKVTQSKFFLGRDTIATIKNATFDITVNGQPVSCSPVHEGGGVYNTGIVPHCGDSLSVHVNVPGRSPISASCSIPQKPDISDVHLEWDTTCYTNQWTNYAGDTIIESYASGNVYIKFRLLDPADERNYYMVRVAYDRDGYHSYEDIWLEDDILFPIDATDEVFDLGLSEDENYGNRILFSDDRINGQKHTVSVAMSYYESWDNTTHFDGKHLVLEIYAVSRDLYLYWRTVNAAQNSDEIFSQIISEPVQVHCNVEDGIGILGGMAAAKYDVGLIGPNGQKAR